MSVITNNFYYITRHFIALTSCNVWVQSCTQDIACKMPQDVPNVVGDRVHSDCARNLASCRQAFRLLHKENDVINDHLFT